MPIWNFDYVKTLGYVIGVCINYYLTWCEEVNNNLNNSDFYVSLLNDNNAFRIKIDNMIKIVYINGTNT